MRHIVYSPFILILFVLYPCIQDVNAQENVHYNNEYNEFNKAVELFEHKNYSAAQKAFNEFIVHTNMPDDALLMEEARFKAAVCAMKLYNRDVQHLIESFIYDHPENPNINQAQFKLANHFYRDKKYRSALKWYNKTDKLALPQEQLSEFYFKSGYCYFVRKEFNKADKAFYEIKDKNDFYGPLAKYFYSHIKYLNKKYQTALEGFNDLRNHALFAKIVPFYITQIYLLQNKYDKIISYAPPMLDKIKGDRTTEIARIIAEAYYNTGNYNKSIEYFNRYEENIESLNDVDFYKIGFANYKAGNFSEATYYLQEVIGVEDSLTQNAAYHLGICYVNTGEKNRAKTAFGIATQNNFDKDISEKALFNYAKLCFELDYSPFNESINSFRKFIDKYPESIHNDEAYDYLLEAILVTKNYEEALKVIENMPAAQRTPEINEAYQRLAYFRALEYFSDLDFDNAVKYMDKSLKYKKYNNKFRALAYYWKADAHYRMKHYDKAISLFRKFLTTRGVIGMDEYAKAHYNIGYAYFKKENYKEAGIWFRKYEEHLGEVSTKMMSDAFNRVGDCFFVNNNFTSAQEYYSKSVEIGKTNEDYAYYQKAIAEGRLKKYNQKVKTLHALNNNHPESKYKPKAVYELGKTYHSNIGKKDSAVFYFNKYVNNYQGGAKVKSALASLANLYYNQGKLNKSLETYKDIVAKYPGTNEAVAALEMIKNIAVEMNDTDYYVNYVEEENIDTDITDREKDSLVYKSAEKLYRDNKVSQAASSFQNYLNKFPEGQYLREATFYLARCFDNLNKHDKALKAYKKVAEFPSNEFTEESVLKSAVISFDKENYKDAYNYYKRLNKITTSNDRGMIALLGMLRSAYLTESYTKVIDAAKKLLKTGKLTDAQQRETYHKMAKSYYEIEQYHLALSHYKKLSNDVTSYEGGEAKYYVSLIYHKQDKDSLAQNNIIEFSKENSPHRYWLAKSFMLLSDIYVEREEFFQSRHMLQSIIDNYTDDTDGIKEEAAKKLDEVVKMEKQEALKDKSRKLKDSTFNDTTINNDTLPEKQGEKPIKDE